MGFNLDDMIGAYKDFARSYLFYAKVTGPGAGIIGPADHTYLVSATTLPAQNLDEITTDWQGNNYKIASTHTYDDFTITFKSDTAHALRENFVAWMNAIHNPVTNEHGNPVDYFGQVDLSQLDTNGSSIMDYSLLYAWPSVVSELTLDYASKEISTFDVTFKYQYHIVNNISGTDATPATIS